jgi:hypothetical protein
MEEKVARKMYEDEATLSLETDFRRDIENWTGVDLKKLPISYRVDFAILDGTRIRGFCELKCRVVEFKTYDSLILSLGKWDALINLQRSTPDMRSRVCVRYLDGDYWYPVSEDSIGEVSVRWGGRNDRGDWQDMEPVVHIPTRLFFEFSRHGR